MRPLLCGRKHPCTARMPTSLLRENIMPKIKTRRSAAKRFQVTGSGKFKRRRQNLRHILTKKDAKRRARLGKGALVDSANLKAVKRLMPYA